MTYWLDLFTGTTWGEFRKAGATITGFRESTRKRARHVKPGDVFLCYLTGVMRWVGALQVVRAATDSTQIWESDPFPVRFAVKPLVVLEPECGIPMERFEGRLDFYAGPQHRGGFKGFLRMSPNRFQREADGPLIVAALREAERNPVPTPLDPRKLARKPSYFKVEFRKGKTAVPTVVTVPETDDDEAAQEAQQVAEPATRHTEIQYNLLKLGAELGLNVWVARNDRSKNYNNELLGAMLNMLDELPTQFNEATTRTIELIDVLWLKGNTILAAFEIEATTSVYSGLLRMSDLLALQPNLDLALYLVAPEERRTKVKQEIRRPTFAFRDKPLPEGLRIHRIRKPNGKARRHQASRFSGLTQTRISQSHSGIFYRARGHRMNP